MLKDAPVETWAAELERLARLLNRVGPDEICCEGLTPRQCCILRTLVDKQGARLSDLASETGITPSALTRVLEKLEKQALVQRVRGSGKDGRAAVVAITPHGRAVRQRIDQLTLERTRAIVNAIPAGFSAALLSGLRLLNQALESGGCCQVTGEGPDISVSCKTSDQNTQPTSRRKHNASQRK